MNPLHLDFDGTYAGEGFLRAHVRARIRSEDYRHRCTLVSPEGAALPDQLMGTHGTLRGRGADFDIAAERCTVQAPLLDERNDAEAVFDELRCVRELARQFDLSQGSRAYVRWVLSGSRFLARFVGGVGREWRSREGDVALVLGGEVHEKAMPASGHAVDQQVLRPELRFEADASNLSVEQMLEQLPTWREAMASVACTLAFYSRASVEWLCEEVGFLRRDGEGVWLERTYRFRRTVAVPPMDSCGPWRETFVAEVRDNLGRQAAQLSAWGRHVRSAIDFYVSSFVLSDESRFIALTTSLEAIKEAYLRQTGAGDILEGGLWGELEGAIRQEIQARVGEADRRARVYEKVRELNRPSYRAVVEEMAEFLGVEMRTLYPGRLTFLEVRNQMIHQGTVPEGPELESEVGKLQTLVESMVMGILDKE